MPEEKVTYCTLSPGNGNAIHLKVAVRKGDMGSSKRK